MSVVSQTPIWRLCSRILLARIRHKGNSHRLFYNVNKPFHPVRSISTTPLSHCYRNKDDVRSEIARQGYFSTKERNKETFIAACQVFKVQEKNLRGHMEFIYAALKHMEEFGVHKDLELYKELIELMPKGKMIPQNMFQAEFMHFPKHQQCAIDLLEQMEAHGVMPDTELGTMLKNVFGKHGHPYKKFCRMLYWMPKFKNASPWPLPDTVPDDAFELAKLGVARMCSVDPASKITVYKTKDIEDSIDDTWIVSGMSHIQEELIAKHSVEESIKVEGPFRIFLRDKCLGYFILRAESKPYTPPSREEIDDVKNINLKFWFTGQMEDDKEETSVINKPSVHEQEDGIIMAVCATGTSSRDSLLSWIRHLEVTNPNLANIPILFTQASPIGDVMTIDNKDSEVQKT